MNNSVATVFEWERYPYVMSTRNLFNKGVFFFTPSFLNTLDTIDKDQKYFIITRDKIKFKQQVGVIRIDGFTLQVFPKLFKERYVEHQAVIARNLAVMLSYTLVPLSPVGMATLAEEDWDLLELFIHLFAVHLLALLSHTQSREYLTERDSLRYVQERILTREYWNPARLHIIPCQYHTFSQDTLINRTLKYCTTLMLRQTRNYETASLLRKILQIVEPVDYTPVNLHEVRSIQLNRLNRKFAPFIKFCEFYLSHTTIALQASNTETFSLMVPMEKVFESFIVGIITHHPHILPKGVRCKTQYPAGHLAHDHNDRGLFRLKPDIVLFYNNSSAVIDTKYKLLSDAKKYDNVSQNDIYQVYAYGAKTNADSIMLLYPDDGDSRYLNWKIIYDHDRQIPLLIRSVTVSMDLMKDLNMFIDQLAHYFEELCPQPHITQIPAN
ncbi:hypothetical protein [Methanospirillum hungatei]|uniref:McrC family protein n=1 Tax=Methanospirillum hungatei TaxID=2203 RepID=UPI0026F35358|nr:hypothetical protein [Methanospirillum hungatei]MCA1915177.1 McrC family protein [Methanospirillum hungatei]